MNCFSIIPLSKPYLKQAIRLAESVFSDEDVAPGGDIKASLDHRKLEVYRKKHDGDLLSLDYYIAIDEQDLVVGLIGLYELRADAVDTDWLGWYCVKPQSRGLQIGKKMLSYAVDLVKKRGKKYLCLYTSTYPNEAKAQHLYEDNGFKVVRKEPEEDGYEIIYRKKEL